MKNKKFISIIIVIVIFICFGICVDVFISKKNVKNNNIVESSNKCDLSYYYESYTNINGFYKGFYLISDAIESNDDCLYSSDINIMKEYKDKIDNMIVPEKYMDAHKYLKESINKYISGTEALYESYKKSNYDGYLSASENLTDAESTLNIYIEMINNDFESFSNLLQSLLQNEYYFDLIKVYDYNDNFTEDENNQLFTLERNIINLTYAKDDLFKAVLNGDDSEVYKNKLIKIKSNIDDIKVSNSNISKYRNQISSYINKYIEIVVGTSDEISKIDYDKSLISKYTDDSSNMNYGIYGSLQGISDFYSEHNTDIGFESALAQTKDYLNTDFSNN